MREIIGIIVTAIFIVIGLYVGVWMMFIYPIMDACRHFDAGTLTGAIIGATVLKCLFAGTVASTISGVGVLIGSFIINE